MRPVNQPRIGSNRSEICRVVVYEEEGSLVAQCLEYDICAFARNMATLRDRFFTTFNAELMLSTQDGGKPFSGIDPAPERFFDMWPSLDSEPERITYANGSYVMAQAA